MGQFYKQKKNNSKTNLLMKKLAIVIPVYNEEENIDYLGKYIFSKYRLFDGNYGFFENVDFCWK